MQLSYLASATVQRDGKRDDVVEAAGAARTRFRPTREVGYVLPSPSACSGDPPGARLRRPARLPPGTRSRCHPTTAGSSTTGGWKVSSGPSHAPTGRSPVNRSHDERPSRIGGANGIAHLANCQHMPHISRREPTSALSVERLRTAHPRSRDPDAWPSAALDRRSRPRQIMRTSLLLVGKSAFSVRADEHTIPRDLCRPRWRPDIDSLAS